MNVATQYSSRQTVSCRELSNVEHQAKQNDAAPTKLSPTASANKQKGRTFLDFLLATLSAPAF
jgi:hypothetical protein